MIADARDGRGFGTRYSGQVPLVQKRLVAGIALEVLELVTGLEGMNPEHFIDAVCSPSPLRGDLADALNDLSAFDTAETSVAVAN
jgi:hypothetical protein